MKAIKRLMIALALVVTASVAALAAGSKTSDGPSIEFKQLKHDFGTIEEDGGPVSCEFSYTNTGSAPLLIINATASCGCTRPEYPKKPVAAGKSEKIKVTYLPKGRPGEFNKTITIRTNDKHHKKVTLKISGFVNPAN